MKNQFCNLEISLKLRELGFDDKCLLKVEWINDSHYNTNEIYLPDAWMTNGYKPNFKYEYSKDKFMEYFKDQYFVKLKIPLWQQAIDWLSTHRKFIVLYPGDNDDMVWMINWSSDVTYKTKEEAILKAIELIRTNKC